jgi:class 3 adenylate cyclase
VTYRALKRRFGIDDDYLSDLCGELIKANGERKTITALFADFKGSTALIEGLDPEEARAIIDPALHLMMDAVHRYEEYGAQALGDGILPCSARHLRMKIIPSGHCMRRLRCKRRCGGMPICFARKGIPRC